MSTILAILLTLAFGGWLVVNRRGVWTLPPLPSLRIKLWHKKCPPPETVDENEENKTKTNQNQAQNEPYFCDIDPDRYTVGRVGDRKWCLGCGVYLGSLEELGSAKFNRIKRCPPCAEMHNRYKRRIARQRRKEGVSLSHEVSNNEVA